MYVTVQTLLGLWSGHVTPALLAVEEIPPAEIEDLLSRVREAPEILFDPATRKTLGFFALVDPLGALVPARVTFRAALARTASHSIWARTMRRDVPPIPR
jgi:hypothetical protein